MASLASPQTLFMDGSLTTSQHIRPGRIGLLAGAGRFPVTFAKAARRQGLSVFCMGVRGMAPEELGEVCDEFVTAPIGKLGRAIRLFKRAGVKRAVMAGKIEKTVLFKPLPHASAISRIGGRCTCGFAMPRPTKPTTPCCWR